MENLIEELTKVNPSNLSKELNKHNYNIKIGKVK